MEEADEYEVVRFYRTDKYPLMMGRLPDGTKLPGGPYTITQGITGIVVILLVLGTWRVWAVFGLLVNIIFAALAVGLSMYLSGLVRTKDRNPFVFALGAYNALTAPAAGKLDKHFKLRKPRSITGMSLTPDLRVRIHPEPPARDPDAEVRAAAAEIRTSPPAQVPGTSPAAGTPEDQSMGRRPVTAIERLMAQSTPRS